MIDARAPLCARPARRTLLAGALLGAVGCVPVRPAIVPMAQQVDALPDRAGKDHLIVFLPGAYDAPADFTRYGFVKAVRERRMAADIVAVDSHLAYFNDYSIAQRMREDVLRPARARGYRSIWLVGISLGGLGSLLTAEGVGGVDGIVALAPYVATTQAIAEVRRAGGLARWNAKDSTATNGWERQLFGWLQRFATGPRPDTRLLLGYGLQDRFAESLSVLAQALDPKTVVTLPGGHDWDTWHALWQRMLDAFGGEIAPRLA